MPDCLHLLASFPGDVDMKVFVTEWKSYLSKRLKVRWQRDFLDRRIRNNEGLDEKARYILQDPVRADLAEHPEDWPYQWEPQR